MPDTITQRKGVSPIIAALVKRGLGSLLILLVIAFLTLFGLNMAEMGRKGIPITIGNALADAFLQVIGYLFNHPANYLWHREVQPALKVVLELLANSAGLLLTSLAIAFSLGVILGVLAAMLRKRNLAPLVLLASIFGVSTPSFLLAMLFWVVNLQIYKWIQTDTALLPPTGFGWDLHLVMPALVLAARPLAQIMQVTYVSMSAVLQEDYIRTARAKGASRKVEIYTHALRNVLIPILTTLGTSLRFSLASLPVVEAFFLWPGLGLALLQAIEMQMTSLVTDLIVCLGFLFIIVNLTIEFIYPVIDPRLRRDARNDDSADETAWSGQWGSVRELLEAFSDGLRNLTTRLFKRKSPPANPKPQILPPQRGNSFSGDSEPISHGSSRSGILQGALTNLPLLVGLVMVIGLLVLAIKGDSFSHANPYETHGVMTIEGAVYTPPFDPSPTFPWGSDVMGRDLQALVLAGARQTMALAFFGMLARLALGVVLGMLSGWWQHSWLDKFINAVISIWAAFPVTLFAMILILGIGIQRGMSVFIIALCVVGWGEVAQFVRSQVIGQKPLLYIEAARSVGARPGGILFRHILPQLWPSVLVLSVLEMGSVLMLLAELGFLNIFLGGGFKAQIAEAGRMMPVIYFFSDVPEWGALLANIRNWWRSYPWLAWYPGLFFFLAILAFNLLGEGFRRFILETRFNLNRLVNRYTLVSGLAALTILALLLRTTAPIAEYKSQALLFDASRAMVDIEVLASPGFQGRETGTGGARMAAEYIASRMEEIGLFPAGMNDSFIQETGMSRLLLNQVPVLEIEGGNPTTYRQDYVEYNNNGRSNGTAEGPVLALGLGSGPEDSTVKITITDLDIKGRIVLGLEEDIARINTARAAGVLLVVDDPDFFEHRYLSIGQFNFFGDTYPMMAITPDLADVILAPTGTGVAALRQMQKDLLPNQIAVIDGGLSVKMEINAEVADEEVFYNVIGYIPGTGAEMRTKSGDTLDSQVIIVNAYFDGVGTGPDGQFYPGANDNASGVAAMLEMARILKQAEFEPEKTIVFVAWSGAERQESFSVKNAMNAKAGFGNLNVEAIIGLTGMGAGSGNGVAIDPGSSYRLVRLFQDAALRLGVDSTNRGRSPHFDRSSYIAFGEITAFSATISWDGSDQNADTIRDTPEFIDLKKLEKSGQTALLAVTVLSREVNY